MLNLTKRKSASQLRGSCDKSTPTPCASDLHESRSRRPLKQRVMGVTCIQSPSEGQVFDSTKARTYECVVRVRTYFNCDFNCAICSCQTNGPIALTRRFMSSSFAFRLDCCALSRCTTPSELVAAFRVQLQTYPDFRYRWTWLSIKTEKPWHFGGWRKKELKEYTCPVKMTITAMIRVCLICMLY